jgi:hypothetical protein
MSASAVRMTTPRPSWATKWRAHDRGDVNRWSWRRRWPLRQPGATGRHHAGAAVVRRSGAGSHWEPVEPAPQVVDTEVRTACSRSTGWSAGPRPPVHERAIVLAALAHRDTSATPARYDTKITRVFGYLAARESGVSTCAHPAARIDMWMPPARVPHPRLVLSRGMISRSATGRPPIYEGLRGRQALQTGRFRGSLGLNGSWRRQDIDGSPTPPQNRYA